MYRFSITTPDGVAQIAISSPWDEPADPVYSGDDYAVESVLEQIEVGGYTPFGHIADDPDFIEPQTIHYIFTAADGFEVEQLEGEPRQYVNHYSREEDEDEELPEVEPESPESVLDDARAPTWGKKLKSAGSMDALKKVFWAALESVSEDKSEPEEKEPFIAEPSTGTGNVFGLQGKDGFGEGIGKVTRQKLNDQAREITKRVTDPDALSEQERSVLIQYSGRGGLGEDDPGAQHEFYTPTPVAGGVWDMLEANGFANGNVLEPSAGSGVFTATKPGGSIMTAVEMDETSAAVNTLLHPGEDNINSTFEAVCAQVDDNTFDSVVGNIPFGEGRTTIGDDPDPAYKSETTLERYFIHRAVDKVKHGGLVALIVPDKVVSGDDYRKFRREISYKAEFLGAVKLPSKTFSQQGTKVITDCILLKKHPEDLFQKINDLPKDTLTETKVLWPTFIRGDWFKKDGKKWITGSGSVVTNAAGKDGSFKRRSLDSDMPRDDMLKDLRRRMAVKFDSRIDWEALSIAEAKPKLYVEGDRRYISNREYEFDGIDWSPVDIEQEAEKVINLDDFGAENLETLRGNLSSVQATLKTMNHKQLQNAVAKFPNLIPDVQRQAVEFAALQPENERELALKGALTGQLIGEARDKHNQGIDASVELTECRRLVELYYSRYGDPRKHKKLVIKGKGSGLFESFTTAKKPNGEFTDLLAGDLVLDSADGYSSKNVQSIIEYLYTSVGERPITIESISELYDGNRKIKTAGDLAEFEGVAVTPEGLIMPDHHYLSGHVYEKIDALNLAIGQTDDTRLQTRYQNQIDALKKARTYTKLNSVKITMADKWVDRRYILEFLSELGYDGLRYVIDEEQYDNEGNVTEVTEVADTARMGGNFKGYEKKGGIEKQIHNYLNNLTIRGGTKVESAAYRDDLAAMDEQFADWLNQHEDFSEIEESYNKVFHPHLRREYSAGQLKIAGLGDGVKLHDYQSQAIRQLSEEGRGILAHGVGLGKTFTALALQKYNRQMGRSNRSCTVVPKSVLANWYHEAKALYKDMDGTLFVGISPVIGEDGQPEQEPVMENGEHKRNKHTKQLEYRDKLKVDSAEEVRRKLWSIPQSNSVKMAVMTQQQFAAIPVKMDTIETYAGEWVDKNLLKDGDAIKYLESSVGKDLGITAQDKKKKGGGWKKASERAKLESKYRQDGTNKNEAYPYYEDMGFDSVVVDEAHDYKNVYNGGRASSQIAYLSPGAVAGRATDMAIKTAYLKKKQDGRGVTLLTATPLTNSPIEVFNALSLVSEIEVFEKMGVANPDDFIRMFGRTENRDRENLKGDIEPVNALVGFENLRALQDIFYRYTNQKTAKEAFSGKPKVSGAPEAVERREFVALDSNEQGLFDELREEAKAAIFSSDEEKREGRPIFSIIRDMERLMTDSDLFYKQITFRFPKGTKDKVQAMLDGLPETVKAKRFDEAEDSQVTVELNKEFKLVDIGGMVELRIAQEWEPRIEAAIKKKSSGLNLEEVTHPTNPKYRKLIANAKLHLDADGKQIIFTEELTQHHRLARILAHNLDGLSLKEIGFINGVDAKDDEKVQAAANSFNQGKTKVIICNKKAEVGINLQKGTTAIHHLGLPFTPASIEQRNGRGVRQGNTAAKVDVYFYLAKSDNGQSIDERRLDILQKKANWINEVMTSSGSSADNADAMDDDTDQYADMFEDDPEQAERRRQQQQAKLTAARRKAERKQAFSALGAIIKAESEIARIDGDKKLGELQKIIDTNTEALEKGRTLSQRVFGGWNEISHKDYPKAKARAEQELAKAQKEFVGRSAGLTEKREKLAKRVTREKSALRNIKARGDLPFDDSLIDNAHQAIAITGTNIILAVGQFWEWGRHLFRVMSVDRSEKTVTLIAEAGSIHTARDDLGMDKGKRKTEVEYYKIDDRQIPHWIIPLTLFPKDKLVQANCTVEEIEIKKFQAQDNLSWRDLADKEIDKDYFMAHGSMEMFKGYSSDAGLIRNASGTLEVVGNLPERDIDQLVWPERDNEKLKKELAELLLPEIKKKGYISDYSDGGIVLITIFGARFKAEMQAYGKQAIEQDVKAAAAQEFEKFKERTSDDLDWNDPEAVKARYFHSTFRSGDIAAPLAKALEDIGDNTSQIEGWVRDYVRSLMEANNAKVDLILAERKRQALEGSIAKKVIQAAINQAHRNDGEVATKGFAIRLEEVGLSREQATREKVDEILGAHSDFKLNEDEAFVYTGTAQPTTGAENEKPESRAKAPPEPTDEQVIDAAVQGAENSKFEYFSISDVTSVLRERGLKGNVHNRQRIRKILDDNPSFEKDGANHRFTGKIEAVAGLTTATEREPLVKADSSLNESGLSDKHVVALADLNLKGRAVEEALNWIGKKGKRTFKNATKPGAIFLQNTGDGYGRAAALFAGSRNKTNKTKFGAGFGENPHPSMPGAWWYVLPETDMDELIEALKSA